jgi:hypothetical protein
VDVGAAFKGHARNSEDAAGTREGGKGVTTAMPNTDAAVRSAKPREKMFKLDDSGGLQVTTARGKPFPHTQDNSGFGLAGLRRKRRWSHLKSHWHGNIGLLRR